jgi:hypothetical protein
MVWLTGYMEKNSIYALPVAGDVLRRCEKKAEHCDGESGIPGSSTTTSAVARSWVNIKKLTGLDLHLESGSILENADESKVWIVTTDALAKRLHESNLELVEDGCWLKVLPKAG